MDQTRSGAWHDEANDKTQVAVQAAIGPPYKAEDYIPKAAVGENPDIPEWHWDNLSKSFHTEIATWVGGQLKPYVGMISASPALTPIVVPVTGTIVTVDRVPSSWASCTTCWSIRSVLWATHSGRRLAHQTQDGRNRGAVPRQVRKLSRSRPCRFSNRPIARRSMPAWRAASLTLPFVADSNPCR